MLAFGSPAFLWGLLALAGPIIVHLINRERAVVKQFPSTRFIDSSRLPQQGRRRLRDLLLLLLRMLIYAAVILALADPRWVGEGEATLSGDDSPVAIVVVDASASMNQDGMAERVSSVVSEAIENLPGDAQVGLVIYDDQVRSVVAPTSSRNPIFEALNTAELPYNRAGKPSVGIAEAARLLGDRAGQILVFSDFQATDWQRASATRLPTGSELELFPVRGEPTRNVGIQSVRVFPTSEGALRLYVRARNDWSDSVRVRLSLDGSEASLDADLPPESAELLVLDVPTEDAPEGGRAAALTIESIGTGADANRFLGDDTFHFWLGGSSGIVVGALIPAEQEPDKLREASFIARALEVGDNTSAQRFDFVAVDGRTPEWLSELDAIYLGGAGAYFDAQAWEPVREFVENGGVLFVTPSKAAPRLFRGMREANISETAYVGKPRRARDRSTIYRIGDLPQGGAMAQVFDKEAREDLYLAEIYEYWAVRPGRSTEVLLETETGDPLILRERLGKGAVIISALDFDTIKTDLPLRNSFVPLLWEILGESVAQESGPPELAVGDRVPSEFASTEIPSGATDQPGILMIDGRPLIINVDRSESITRAALLSDVRGRLTTAAGARQPDSESPTGPGSPLWPWLGALALLACVVESVLAGRSEQPTLATA